MHNFYFPATRLLVARSRLGARCSAGKNDLGVTKSEREEGKNSSIYEATCSGWTTARLASLQPSGRNCNIYDLL